MHLYCILDLVDLPQRGLRADHVFGLEKNVTAYSPDIARAFRCLGVTPLANKAAIRNAWKAMVRTYHPDQFVNNKEAANRRLAEINAAFDLLSDWTAEDAAACAANQNARQGEDDAKTRAAHKAAQARKAQEAEAAASQKRAAEARATAEAEARQRAAAIERAEELAKAAKAESEMRKAAKASHDCNSDTARTKFLAGLFALAPKAQERERGYV